MNDNADSTPVSEWTRLPKGQGELILLVEDDRLLLVISQRILTKLGYQVVATNSPHVGFLLWQARKDEIKLILTDYHFREAETGMDLLLKVHWQVPEFPVLLVSGRWQPNAKDGPPLPPHTAYLMKPYRLAELAETIHRLLTERSSKPLPWKPRDKPTE